MYFQLTEAVKRRFILELRRFWATHPKYQDLVDGIQGKYSFGIRPPHGIIVKTGSASKVDLSADSYVGRVVSHVMLANWKRYPGHSIEWVREDTLALQANGDRFPSPPGVYFINIIEDPDDPTQLAFTVDAMLDVYHEQVLPIGTSALLQNPPIAGTTRVYEMPADYMLYEGKNYELALDGDGKPTGELILAEELSEGRYLSIDYRYTPEREDDQIPYWRIYPKHANHKAIPGCVIAFGNRVKKGDRQVIVVQEVRSPTALEYGGRWSLSIDFEVFSRDVYAQQEIADTSVMYFWGLLRPRLATEGIEIMDISLGGESEEIYDDTGDDYFYNSSFSMTVETDWAIHVPLPIFLRRVEALSEIRLRELALLTDAEAAQAVQSNIQALDALGLEAVADPFFLGRGGDTYEIIR